MRTVKLSCTSFSPCAACPQVQTGDVGIFEAQHHAHSHVQTEAEVPRDRRLCGRLG